MTRHQFSVVIDTKDPIPSSMCSRLAERAYGIMAMSGRKGEVDCVWSLLPETDADPEAKVLVVIDGGKL